MSGRRRIVRLAASLLLPLVAAACSGLGLRDSDAIAEAAAARTEAAAGEAEAATATAAPPFEPSATLLPPLGFPFEPMADGPYEGFDPRKCLGTSPFGQRTPTRAASDRRRRKPEPAYVDDRIRWLPATRAAGDEPTDRLAIRESGFVRSRGLDTARSVETRVDPSIYALLRRAATAGSLVESNKIHVAALLNAFRYRDAEPTGGAALALKASFAPCPWEPKRRLLRVALTTRPKTDRREPIDVAFVVDRSTSMETYGALRNATSAISYALDFMRPDDRVAVVAFANEAATIVGPTSLSDADGVARLRRTLDDLRPNGATNGLEGLRFAVDHLWRHGRRDVARKAILLSDGDFTLGWATPDGVAFQVGRLFDDACAIDALGVSGNVRRSVLGAIASAGNGRMSVATTASEAARLLADLVEGRPVVARDVELSVAFEPKRVRAYRPIGFEGASPWAESTDASRVLRAGDAHVALFEVEVEEGADGAASNASACVVTVEFRDESRPGDARSTLVARPEFDVVDPDAADDVAFACVVVRFGSMMRGESRYGPDDWDALENDAAAAVDAADRVAASRFDPRPDVSHAIALERAEFLSVVLHARRALGRTPVPRSAGSNER
jgi:Ca-activated chloride channel homolog